MKSSDVFSRSALYRILPVVGLGHALVFIGWQHRVYEAEFPLPSPKQSASVVSVRLTRERVRQITRSKAVSAQAQPAPSTSVETQQMSAESSSSVSARSEELAATYLEELRALLEQNKHYPPIAKRLGQQGQVEVAFSVRQDGEIVGVEVATASPFDLLNQAALTTVQKVRRFKPIPEDLSSGELHFRIPIEFSIN